MLAEERFALILDLLARQRTATVQELCEALSASESTIRRDLNELDKMGRLNKVHALRDGALRHHHLRYVPQRRG